MKKAINNKKSVKKISHKNKKQNIKRTNKKQKEVKKVKRVRIRYKRVILFLLLLTLIIYLIVTFVKFPIKNIYISGNHKMTDQEIIEIAGISNYPSIISTTSNEIEKKLKKNIYVKSVEVKKKRLKEIYIKIEENYPLFYYQTEEKTVFNNLKELKEQESAPIVVNYIIDDVYELFKKKMQKIDKNIIDRISEIKYDPNSVDEERFIFTMNDGNYVYLTLEKIESINNYVDIIKNFENKKGILYLDSGEYFKVFE